jgi:ATP-dependent RNA helicase DDX23/PRP28
MDGAPPPPPPPPEMPPPPPPPPPPPEASEQTEDQRFEERLRIMNSKSWVDKMMNKYEGALHYSDKKLEDMDPRDWRIFREDNEISTKGNMRHPGTGKQILPFRYWPESNMPQEVLAAIKKAGYERPTGVQMMCIPLGLACKDVIGVAKTGSGKTCAFVLPMLVYILKQPPITKETAPDGPLALIMAPTRELVQQIEDETRKFAGELKIRVYSVVGGLSIEEQSFITNQGTEVMVATPGRLNDALDRRYMVLNQCNYVVLDEADRMIDMGFEPQVKSVLEAMPSSNLKPIEEDVLIDLNEQRYRQTFMFSATMPPQVPAAALRFASTSAWHGLRLACISPAHLPLAQVERIAKTYMRNPAIVYIGDQGSSKENITQHVFVLKENKKKDKLMEMLGGGLAPPIIIFCNGKRGCDVLGKSLDKQGFPTAVIHSGKDQVTREQAIDGFKSGEFEILVATDIAGRGIDVEGVEHVINYDMPKDIESYTHRIGRTGRAGRKGAATTFVTGEGIEENVLYDLKLMLEKCKQPVPLELSRHPACVSWLQVRPV